MRAAVVIAILAAAGVGCGAGTSATGNMPAPPPAAASSLKITVWPEGRSAGSPQRYTLRCAPARGTLPKPGNACVKLGRMAKPFAPLPKDIACTEQYGGPGEALVTGTYKGKPVRAAFSLRNGCEISRSKAYGFLLPGMSGGAAA